MKIWWIIGTLFLLSKAKPQPVSTSPGGMTPVEPMGDAVGKAIDAVTGQQVTVVNPLPTTIVGNVAPSTTFGLDTGDEAFVPLPALVPVAATPGPAPTVAPVFLGPPVPAYGQLGNDAPPLQNPDTLPGVWPGLQPGVILQRGSPTTDVAPPTSSPTNPTPPPTMPLAPGDPRAGSAMIAVPTFDLTKDSFFVPGFGEEDFSAGALTPDEKLQILRNQGYTGPDPRMISVTPLAQAQDLNPLVNPVTGRVALPNV